MNGHSAPGRTFVGFGFGAIQAGLFLYEAQQSGAFGRLVVAEVVPETVAALRAAGGLYRVNIAHAAGIEQAQVGPVEVYNPNDKRDREALVAAIAEADEMATAVPSVAFYADDRPGSIHRLLAQGLARKAENHRSYAVLYAAENHNHAAEQLIAAVADALPKGLRDSALNQAAFVNTVIGKMSGVHAVEEGLAATTPGAARAFLVEEFNHILIGRVRFGDGFAGHSRGIQAFVEKDDLLPFEEAKLYGHNAMHALAAYLGSFAGLDYMHELVSVPGLLDFVREAAIKESGAALIKRHAGLHDPLFTSAGIAAYIDDLLVRMTNPWLRDSIERVGRDPARKLAWDDRLVGTMRLVLDAWITPQRFGVGVAAALRELDPGTSEYPGSTLRPLWNRPAADARVVEQVDSLAAAGWALLDRWRESNFSDLDLLIYAGPIPGSNESQIKS